MSKKILLCEARKAELDTNSLRKTIRRMPSHRLTVLLPPKLKKFVDDLVSKRRYGTENDIICSALRQWQVRNREIHKDFSAIRRNLKHRTPQVREAARKQFQARILEMAARAGPKRRPQYDENEFIRKLLKRKDKHEALSWLTDAPARVDRGIGEMDNLLSVAYVRHLYKLGVSELVVVEIAKNKNLESTDSLVATLPKDPKKRRAIFTSEGQRTIKMGYDATEDHGQSHLFIWFD